MSADIDNDLNLLLGHVDLQIRQVVKSHGGPTRFVCEKLNVFVDNLGQLIKDLPYHPSVQDSSSAGEDGPQVVTPRPCFTTGGARSLSEYETVNHSTNDFTNALRSSGANQLIFTETENIEPALLTRAEQRFTNDFAEATSAQSRWPGQGLLDTSSVFQAGPFSLSPPQHQSDLNGFPEQASLQPDDLSQIASQNALSPASTVQVVVSNGSCNANREEVPCAIRSKKRRGGVDIEPRAKRLRPLAPNNANAAGILPSPVTDIESVTPPQHSAGLLTGQQTPRRSNPSFVRNDIQELFEDRLGQRERQHAPYLTMLFFAIASPLSFRQLFEAIRAIQSRQHFHVSRSRLTIADVLGRLEVLDDAMAAFSLLRRFYLLRLCRERARLKNEIQAERLAVRSGRNRTGGGFGKIASLILTRMTEEAYPSSAASQGEQVDRQDKRKALQNRLQAAQHWNMLQEEFSAGIIALVPVGREFKIQNQDVEYMRSRPFSILVEVLKDLRGDFIRKASELLTPHIEAILEDKNRPFALKLEQLDDPHVLSTELPDSEALLDLCKPAPCEGSDNAFHMAGGMG